MVRRYAVALAVLGVACGDGDPMEPTEGSGLEFISYRMLESVEDIEPLPDGYAVLGAAGLVAYDDDDQTRWEVVPGGTPLALGPVADDGALRVASEGDGSVVVDRVGLDGVVEDAFDVTHEDGGPLDDPQVVLRDDGSAWVHGGRWPSFWQGLVDADGNGEVVRSETEERRQLIAARDGEAYALRVTWSADLEAAEAMELQRLAADGSPRWTVTVHDGSHDANGAFELGGTLGPDGRGGVYVLTLRTNMVDPGKTVTRRYDADGALVSDESEPQTEQSSLRSLARPGGGSLWLEGVAGAKINVRLVDLSGQVSDEASFDGDGTPITDATFIGDVLHVLTEGGMTRIYVPPVELPPVG